MRHITDIHVLCMSSRRSDKVGSSVVINCSMIEMIFSGVVVSLEG